MYQGVESRRRGYTTIYAPPELKEKIKALSEKLGRPQWKVLLEAITFYETLVRKPKAKEELPSIDKAVWYLQKLSMSIGALKENPSDANLQKTLKTVSQIRERLKVDTSILEKAVSDFVMTVKNLSTNAVDKHSVLDEITIELNMALKSVLIEIVYRYILKEEVQKKEASTVSQQL